MGEAKVLFHKGLEGGGGDLIVIFEYFFIFQLLTHENQSIVRGASMRLESIGGGGGPPRVDRYVLENPLKIH